MPCHKLLLEIRDEYVSEIHSILKKIDSTSDNAMIEKYADVIAQKSRIFEAQIHVVATIPVKDIKEVK